LTFIFSSYHGKFSQQLQKQDHILISTYQSSRIEKRQ
jgi:hypothetical protein